MSVNKVILVGRLGKDPEARNTPGGAMVVNFTLATSETWTDKQGQKQEKTEWHRIVVWGRSAEICNQYLTKGKQVYIEGKIQTRQWQDKDGATKYTTEINASSVQFLGGASSERGAPSPSAPNEAFPPASGGETFGQMAPSFGADAFIDDVPF